MFPNPLLDDTPEMKRARLLDQIDDILNTAAGENRPLSDSERREHDQLATQERLLAMEINRSGSGSPYGGGSPLTAPMINRSAVPAHGNRSGGLDDLLWATSETVRAGEIHRSGTILADPRGATNPVEAVRMTDGHYAPRISDFREDHRGVVRSFQQTVADMCLFGMMVDRTTHSSSEGFQVARAHPAYADRWQSICRALDVDTSGEGGNWVPTGIGSTMHEKVRAAGKVAPLFPRVDLPSNPWKWPIEGSDAVAYRVGEPTGDTESKMTASTPGTVAATFDAEIFGARAMFSRSVDADSAVVMVPFVTGKLVRAFVTAEERCILDGDTDGTHQDSDVGASTTDARTAWDGLRKKGLAQTSDNTNSALTAAKVLTLRSGMGKWGINPSELAIICSVSSYYDLLGDTNLLTLDKLGPQATILNGQLGSLYGAPVIVSEYVREDLNASGVYDGITTTKTYFLVVNRAEWAMGQRMAIDVQVDDSIYRETFQRVAVAFSREDFQHIGEAATDDNTGVGYNVTP